MLLTAAEDGADRISDTLRVVLLGGDWVTTDLPGRLHAQVPACRFAGLGGTTETAIHSTLYEVPPGSRLPAWWRAVPYGRPSPTCAAAWSTLSAATGPTTSPANCGSAATASLRLPGRPGAHRRPVRRTRRRTLYRTSDWPRYLPDGTLEFLGRRDHQVQSSRYQHRTRRCQPRLLAASPAAPGRPRAGAAQARRPGQVAAAAVAEPGLDEAKQDFRRRRRSCSRPTCAIPDYGARCLAELRADGRATARPDRASAAPQAAVVLLAGGGPRTTGRRQGPVEEVVAAVWRRGPERRARHRTGSGRPRSSRRLLRAGRRSRALEPPRPSAAPRETSDTGGLVGLRPSLATRHVAALAARLVAEEGGLSGRTGRGRRGVPRGRGDERRRGGGGAGARCSAAGAFGARMRPADFAPAFPTADRRAPDVCLRRLGLVGATGLRSAHRAPVSASPPPADAGGARLGAPSGVPQRLGFGLPARAVLSAAVRPASDTALAAPRCCGGARRHQPAQASKGRHPMPSASAPDAEPTPRFRPPRRLHRVARGRRCRATARPDTGAAKPWGAAAAGPGNGLSGRLFVDDAGRTTFAELRPARRLDRARLRPVWHPAARPGPRPTAFNTADFVVVLFALARCAQYTAVIVCPRSRTPTRSRTPRGAVRPSPTWSSTPTPLRPPGAGRARSASAFRRRYGDGHRRRLSPDPTRWPWPPSMPTRQASLGSRDRTTSPSCSSPAGPPDCPN
ncbi:hypothetical protein ACU686_15540 [Yinghuangia aomiensis]